MKDAVQCLREELTGSKNLVIYNFIRLPDRGHLLELSQQDLSMPSSEAPKCLLVMYHIDGNMLMRNPINATLHTMMSMYMLFAST